MTYFFLFGIIATLLVGKHDLKLFWWSWLLVWPMAFWNFFSVLLMWLNRSFIQSRFVTGTFLHKLTSSHGEVIGLCGWVLCGNGLLEGIVRSTQVKHVRPKHSQFLSCSYYCFTCTIHNMPWHIYTFARDCAFTSSCGCFGWLIASWFWAISLKEAVG